MEESVFLGCFLPVPAYRPITIIFPQVFPNGLGHARICILVLQEERCYHASLVTRRDQASASPKDGHLRSPV